MPQAVQVESDGLNRAQRRARASDQRRVRPRGNQPDEQRKLRRKDQRCGIDVEPPNVDVAEPAGQCEEFEPPPWMANLPQGDGKQGVERNLKGGHATGAPKKASRLRPRFVSIRDACDYLGCSRSYFYATLLPEVKTIALGKRRLIDFSSLEQLGDKLLAAG